MILVIDNYDSFTWNLVHYLMELGAEVEVVRKDIKNLHLGVYPPLGRVRVAVPLVLGFRDDLDDALVDAVDDDIFAVYGDEGNGWDGFTGRRRRMLETTA